MHFNTARYSELFTTGELMYCCYMQPKHIHSFKPVHPPNNRAGVQNSQEPGHHGELVQLVVPNTFGASVQNLLHFILLVPGFFM